MNDVIEKVDETDVSVRECIKKLEELMSHELESFLSARYIQNLARVYVYLNKINPEIAAKCLSDFPEEIKAGIERNLPKIELFAPETLADVAHVLEDSKLCDPVILEEYRAAASKTSCDYIIDELENTNPLLAGVLESITIMFKDVLRISDRDMQRFIMSLDNEILRHALIDVEPALLDKFFRNMSRRSAKMLEEDIACAKLWTNGSMEKIIRCRCSLLNSFRDFLYGNYIPLKPLAN